MSEPAKILDFETFPYDAYPIGSVVTLVFGGPLMVINSASSRSSAYVFWFNKSDELQRGDFGLDVLRLADWTPERGWA